MVRDHLEKLIYFQTVAAEKSFLAASRYLRISQPALSKAIKILEESFATPLFVRHRRGVDLTNAGQLLFEYMQKFSVELENIEIQISSSSSVSGHLKIGTFETLGLTIWPKILKILNEQAPDLKISLMTASPQEHWQKLDSEVLHIIVDAEPPLAERYYSKVLYSNFFAVYQSPHFVRHDSLPPYAFVRRAFDQESESIEHALNRMQVEFRLAYDLDTFVAAQEVAKAGLALCTPHLICRDGDKDKTTHGIFVKKRSYPLWETSHLLHGP